MGNFTAQLNQILRRFRRAPLFTLATLITLAAGIGANTVVFSVVRGVLLKPLSYPQPDQLIGLWHTAPGINLKQLNMCPSMYFIYREQNRSFQEVGMYSEDSVSVTGLAQPEQVRALRTTEGTLPILGIPPMLGRWFDHQDDTPGSPKTAVLTYGYWRDKFGSSPAAIGRTLTLDGEPVQIIGVMPQRFHFFDEDDLSLLLPLQLDRSKTVLGRFSYEGIARLKPGVTIAQASADVARMIPITERTFPSPPGFSVKLFEDAHIAPMLHPVKDDVIGDVGNALWLLMASIGMVLLIACANVANLLLVRVEGRRQELAVRSALGASWRRLASDMLLESIVLGLMGSAIGLAFAYGALRALVAIAPDGLPRLHEIAIDGQVLLFTLGISIFASVLCSAIPIIKYAGSMLSGGLREGGRTLSQTRQQHRARNVLVVVQVSLAIVLLICSGLMIRTLHALTNVNPGFTGPATLQTFRISIPEAQVKEPESALRMEQAIRDRIAAVPGVSAVAFSTARPMDGYNSNDPVFAEDRTYAEGELPPLRRFNSISPGYFSAMGTPLLAGRDFTWAETYNKAPMAIVSENLAREYWQSPAMAIGKRIRVATTDDWRQIIGVVANVHYDGVSEPANSSVYWPMIVDRFEGQPTTVQREVAYSVRSSRVGSASLMADVRGAVWAVNPNLPLADVHSLEYFYKMSMARTSFTLVMLAVAGAMSLLLGAVGIYGVIAYSVSQRTREIGIRMALGAERQAVTKMFVRDGLLLAVIGVGIGLVAAFAVMRVMSSLLFGVSPDDPVTYLLASLGVVATAWLATYLPSRRAASIDPVEALRTE
ncbi:MAG: ABC transporter permease [Candidatus Acidiferrales bacterium]